MPERFLSRNNARRSASVAVRSFALSALAFGAFVEAMLAIGGASFEPAAAAWIVAAAAVIVASGLLIVEWSVPDLDTPRLALAIVAGSAAASLFLVAGCFATGLRADVVFVCWTVIVVALSWHVVRRGATMRIDGWEIAAVVMIELVVAFWCRRPAAAFPALQATGILPAWSDYFIHGAQIDQFGARLATGRSSFAVSGQSVDFYHYGSFMLPAVVAGVVDRPGVAVATSVFFPLGVLLCALGVYGFVRVLVNGSAGLVATLALLIVPDASAYALRNGTLGFHWFLGASPGTDYALGTAFAALAFFVIWRRTGSRKCLWTGALFTAALVQIRVHVLVLFMPALVATLISESRLVRGYRRGPAAIAFAAIAGLFVLVTIAAAQHQSDHFKTFRDFLDIVHTGQAPSAYDGMYASIQGRYGPVVAEIVGFLWLIPASLGALTVLGPVAAVVATRGGARQPLDSFPLWCLLGWLGLVVVVPAGLSSATTYQYHPFALVYAAVFVWTFVFLWRAAVRSRDEFAPLPRAISGLAVTALAVVAVAAAGEDPVRPRMAWAMNYYGLNVDRGLLDAASFVRNAAEPGDSFMLIPAEPSAIDGDAAIRFASMADVPAHLSRAGIYVGKPWLREVVEQRLAQSRQIESAIDPKTAFELARRAGVTFLVTAGPGIPRFDPNHDHATFQTGDIAVYRLVQQ